MSILSAITWQEQDTFWRDDNDVHFVLDQHTKLDFHSTSSLEREFTGRHVNPCKPVFALTP